MTNSGIVLAMARIAARDVLAQKKKRWFALGDSRQVFVSA